MKKTEHNPNSVDHKNSKDKTSICSNENNFGDHKDEASETMVPYLQQKN
jgi:hypothetical protein